jgi:hypothetical protein
VALVPSPDQPGFYLVSYGGLRPGSALAVVNLTSELESNLRATPPTAATDQLVPAATRSGIAESPGDLAFVAAALALAAIVAQVWWLTRAPGRVEASRDKAIAPARRRAA